MIQILKIDKIVKIVLALQAKNKAFVWDWGELTIIQMC
jgi:hypothetical protein